MTRWLLLSGTFALVAACGDDGGAPANTAYFDLSGAIDTAATFWNLPFPSDLRLEDGAPNLTGYPNPRSVPILSSLLVAAADRKGWPTMPIAYLRFTAPVPERVITEVVPADDPALVLIDIDPTSPEQGARYPLVAATLPADAYVTSNLVALAPRPGIVLRAKTKYAYVIRSAFAPGFTPAPQIAAMAAGKTPEGAMGGAATALYVDLWPALDAARIPVDDVLTATVFTTGDEVARLRARSEGVRATYHPTIDNLQVLSPSSAYEGFCALGGTITLPQFQMGSPPFDSGGRFVLGADDLPNKQSDATVNVVITLPKTQMPTTGWPLYQWIHGSGGVPRQLVDRGRTSTPEGIPEAGKGPGYVVARYGIAGASSALPVNPERFPGASDYAYININNLSAFPYTFQQGVIEQRLFLDALLALQIPQATLAGCGNTVTNPATNPTHFFDATKVVAGGQSMGGMYTNMTAAVEERWGALVPTGAGGFWNFMILETELIPGARQLLGTAFGVDDALLVFAHPGLDALALGWESAEPIAYMNRINQRPLEGLPKHDVYQPIPKDDENFTTSVYDAATLAYGNEQAGDVVWPTLQPALALAQLDGIVSYPVKANLDGKTRIAVQFEGDGIVDPHYIFAQLDSVKHQYGCFLMSYLRDGVPTVPAPGALTDPCP